jgi:hypothetical protein
VNETFYRDPGFELHICERSRTLPDKIFEKAAAHDVALESEIAGLSHREGGVVSFAIGTIPGNVYSRSETHSAEPPKLLGKAGEKRRHHVLPAEQQSVDMVALWDRFVERGPIFDPVALEHGDAVEVVAEHSCAHQSRQAAADYNCMVSQPAHHLCFLWQDVSFLLRGAPALVTAFGEVSPSARAESK